MNAPKLELRCIDDLIGDAFFIPSYQRGYRWSSVEVKALLDDLEEFRQAKRREARALRDGGAGDHRSALGNFYCLQPVVVLPRGESKDGRKRWELIDGQQRLTTIHLIIRYLDKARAMVDGNYSLSYETRQGGYLTDLDPALRWESPDAFYMHQANETIEAWFEAKGRYAARDIADVLLLPDDRSDFNTKVIWYELPEAAPESQAEIDAFIRLNAGKIRLTNAELIRALFLKAGNFERDLRDLSQIKMAQEWDRIEKRLQDDRFWYFLHGGPSRYATRIDHVFQLHLQQTHPELLREIPSHAEFRTFLGYQKLETNAAQLDSDARISSQWTGVRSLAMRLEEWDEDRVLYHLVGFWVALRASQDGTDNADVLVDLLARRDQRRHLDFEEDIKASIFAELMGKRDLADRDEAAIRARVAKRLDGLTYGGKESNRRIRLVLLLFNIATLLQNRSSTVRFPFDLFSRQEWDIEHIRPVESRRPKKVPDQKAWLAVIIEYWTGVGASQLLPDSDDELAARREAVGAALETDADQTAGAVNRALRSALGLAEEHQLNITADLGASEQERATRDDKVATLLGVAWLMLAEERFTREVQDQFSDLFDDVLALFDEKEALVADHSLGNLTLLDASTNRRFRNAPFPIKRRHVLAHDRGGTFVPRCTTNVFLKYYSQRLQHLMTWSEDCARSHHDAVVNTLTAFFVKGGHRPQDDDHA